jgi:aerotaxis receptor
MMRDNGPVTNREVEVPETEMLVSRTDPGGRIVFCNSAFVAVSGFGEDELLGAPHNLVRHPDMPPAAFRNLWETIKAGRVWEGLVKNRTKAGDHYWVRANVTPVIEDGELRGYVSIRVRPERDEVRRAETAYALLRSGNGGHLALRQGEVVSRRPLARLGRAWRSVTGRLALAGLSFVVTLGIVTWLAMLGGHEILKAAVAAAGLGASVLMGWMALSLIRRSLAELETCFDRIAGGDYRTPIQPPAAEFHEVAMRLRGTRAKLGYVVQERAESDRRAAKARQAAVSEMADKIEAATREGMDGIRGRTSAMAREAEGMAAAVAQVRSSAEGASTGANEALANVQAVAAATEQLAASVREITEQAARAGAATQCAVAQSERTQEVIRGLAGSLGKVEEVVSLIRGIAEQTNLLALNATIEAARAGDAGKGFAVVAGEVKGLATQTARSTGDITGHIGEILAASRQAVEAVDEIGRSIAELSGVSSSIAAAMEQQAAATQEIARNVAGSSQAVQAANERVAEVHGNAGSARQLAEEVRGGTVEVDRQVCGMRETLVRLVRNSMEEADRRAEQRYTVQQSCTVEVAGARREALLLDVSRSGCLVAGLAGVGRGTVLRVVVPGWGASADFRVVEASERGLHLLIEGDHPAWTHQVERRFETVPAKASARAA